MELMLIIVATFGQTLCAPGIGVSMMGILTFWRFMVRALPCHPGALPDLCVRLRWVSESGVTIPLARSSPPSSPPSTYAVGS